MSYEMKGTVKRLFPVWKSETSEFYKREFVVTTAEQYPSDVKFSALKEKSDQLAGLQEGDTVNVKFDVKGREYNDRYYVDLNAWRVEKMGAERCGSARRCPLNSQWLQRSHQRLRSTQALLLLQRTTCPSDSVPPHDRGL